MVSTVEENTSSHQVGRKHWGLIAGAVAAALVIPQAALCQMSARSAVDDFAIIIKDQAYSSLGVKAACPPGSPAAQTACIERAGYKFDYSVPEKCVLAVTLSQPLPSNAKKNWEGKLEGRYLLGSRLLIPLAELDAALIRKEDPATFSLYFELKDGTRYSSQVRYSTTPTQWNELPLPPTLSDVPSDFGNAQQRLQEFSRKFDIWQQVILEVYDVPRGTSFPFFSVSNFFEHDLTNTADGVRLLQENRGKLFLKFRTSDLRRSVGGREVENFVTTIKSILRDCRPG